MAAEAVGLAPLDEESTDSTVAPENSIYVSPSALVRVAAFAGFDRWDFSRMSISVEDMTAVMEGVASANPPIEGLYLNGADLDDRHVTIMCEYLRNNATLETLHVGENKITDVGLTALCDAIESNDHSGLLQLWLKRNQITAVGIARLARFVASPTHAVAKLQCLDLWNMGLGVEGTRTLCEALSSNRSLSRLYIGMNGLGPEGAAMVGAVLAGNATALVSLSIDMNDLGDEGVTIIGRSLANNTVLRRLCLKFNRVTPAGAAGLFDGLQANNALHSLILGHIDDLTAVSAISHLTVDEIGAMANAVGTVGLLALSRLLRTSQSLHSIVIANARLKDGEGAPEALEALRESLVHNTTVTALVFNEVDEAAGRAVEALVVRNRATLHQGLVMDAAEIRHHYLLDTVRHYRRERAKLQLDRVVHRRIEAAAVFRELKVTKRQLHKELEDQRDPDSFDEDEAAKLQEALDKVVVEFRQAQTILHTLEAEETRLRERTRRYEAKAMPSNLFA